MIVFNLMAAWYVRLIAGCLIKEHWYEKNGVYVCHRPLPCRHGGYSKLDRRRFGCELEYAGEWGSSASTAENTSDTHFQGEGIMVVTAASSANVSNSVWDAEGADAMFSTPENWEGDAAPAFDGFDNLIFGSGGTVEVGAGLVEDVGWLRINGTEKRAGTYGAAGSGAQYVDSTHFSGSGMIRVLHDNGGTLIILR
jgi:hypothetical protein